jgi:hypothetical protein
VIRWWDITLTPEAAADLERILAQPSTLRITPRSARQATPEEIARFEARYGIADREKA